MGALFAASDVAFAVGGQSNNGGFALAGTVEGVEVRKNGTLVASPDFTGHETSDPFTDDQGNEWSVQGDATLSPQTAVAEKGGFTVPLASIGAVNGKIRDYRGTPYRDEHTGLFHVAGFGPVTGDEEGVRGTLQLAIDACSDDGGGTVFLPEQYVVGPDSTGLTALTARSDVSLIGVSSVYSRIKLIGGANCHLLAGAGEVVDNQEESTFRVQIRDLAFDGNKANQDGLGGHDGLHFVRFPHHNLTRVQITDCDGDGLYTSGKSELGDMSTRTTRPIHHTDLTIEHCERYGYNASATNRQVYVKGLHTERCGSQATGEGGGMLLDHSEDHISSASAILCYGDGIRIHNVRSAHYGHLHAVNNEGLGIYVEAMVASVGYSWVAAANCTNYRAASHRDDLDLDDSAEIYFYGRGGGSYGTTHNSVVQGIVAPGDKGFGGPSLDNRSAEWGIFVEDGIILGTEDATTGEITPDSLRLSGFAPGDGGLTGAIRVPTP